MRPTAEAMRNYQHWQRQQDQVMQQCDQRFLYPTQSNSNNNQANPNQMMQYQVLTQQHLNPQLKNNLVPSTSQTSAAPQSTATNQVEHEEPVATNVNTLGPLPDGWERRFDQNGRPYFVNHKNKVIHLLFLFFLIYFNFKFFLLTDYSVARSSYSR